MKIINIHIHHRRSPYCVRKRYTQGRIPRREKIFERILSQDHYQGEETEVLYLISRLYGIAMNWALTLIENKDPCLTNYQALVAR